MIIVLLNGSHSTGNHERGPRSRYRQSDDNVLPRHARGHIGNSASATKAQKDTHGKAVFQHGQHVFREISGTVGTSPSACRRDSQESEQEVRRQARDGAPRHGKSQHVGSVHVLPVLQQNGKATQGKQNTRDNTSAKVYRLYRLLGRVSRQHCWWCSRIVGGVVMVVVLLVG